MNILDDLKFRGLLNQFTDLDVLTKRLEKSCVLYCGFDVTADSLQVGNLLALLTLKRFQLFGHQPIALLGNGTSLIGDPSGKKSERVLNTKETVAKWSKQIEKQIEKIVAINGKGKTRVVGNLDWLGKIKMIDFVRDIGKHFSLGYMLDKESVRSRLEAGISFTEFSYMLLQSYDFWNLNKKYNCELQIGGSDQWGNITAGIDFIRKAEQKEVYALTIPLITKSDGSKFGKTETGTIWLDAKKTTPYQFYQFWINIDDKDIINFLKYFTFLSHEEIIRLENEEVAKNPQNRVAQKVLAKELTKMVHGEKELKKAEEITNALFGGDIKKLSEKDIENVFQDMSCFETEKKEPIDMINLLVDAKICESKRQAKEDIENRAISTFEFKKCMVVRRGKKNYFLIKWK
ncbi:MAG TPA: tyrosine--tRNA ligase [Candidatus Portnoybacteria bacterium]|nr:tyrosine--tRNA ligase [Candidatus Portnoybacteria bacterium]HPM28454.1 tyrosine--tRNA ligase [Candidatus Portnoybacteria bacterium]